MKYIYSSCLISSVATQQGDIDRLEAVQKFVLKLISRRWDLAYEEMLSITKIPRLYRWKKDAPEASTDF